MSDYDNTKALSTFLRACAFLFRFKVIKSFYQSPSKLRRSCMSFSNKFFLATAGLVALSAIGAALPVRAEPLEQAVIAALNNHPAVEAAIANRNAYAEERREQWADYFPTLNMRATGGRVYGDNSTSRGLSVTRGAAYSHLWEGSVTLTQPLFDGFETVNRVDAAGLRQRSANFEIADVREDLARRAALAYLDVLRGREILERIRAHGKKIADYQGRIQKMVDEGAADATMAVQAKDIKAQLDATLADVEGQLDSTNAEYAELTGHLPDDAMAKPATGLDLLPPDAAAAAAHAVQSHPALRAAHSSEQALASDKEAEKQFYYPDVNGELSYLKRDQLDEIGGEAIDAKAVVRLNWDLSVAGGQVARVRKTQQREYEGRAKKEETQRRIEREIAVAYSEMAAAQERLEVLNERVRINEDLFGNYEAQFEGARVTLLQLLQSDNALFNARLAQLNGEYKLAAAQYNALASIGRLQESLNLMAAKRDAE